MTIELSEGRKVYFVADVHLGLKVGDPDDREKRFVDFLRGIAGDAQALVLLGDIWDFWYEYRDVVPKGYVQVFAALQDLMASGVQVFFFQGNHDVWTFHYFEDMGMIPLKQPYDITISGKKFCLGHGDGLGPAPKGYLILRKIFHSRLAQGLFSTLHPWLAFRFGNGWSCHNRLARNEVYTFKGEEEPLAIFALEHSRANGTEYFVFGHFHTQVDMKLENGSRLMIVKDWIDNSPYIYFDGMETFFGYSQNSLK